jgi:hypothetical protein
MREGITKARLSFARVIEHDGEVSSKKLFDNPVLLSGVCELRTLEFREEVRPWSDTLSDSGSPKRWSRALADTNDSSDSVLVISYSRYPCYELVRHSRPG